VSCAQQLADLRAQGAHHRDPVRFHYLEVLAQRAQSQQGRVQQLLNNRLAQALAQWRGRFEPSAHPTTPTAHAGASRRPVQPATLPGLLSYLAQHAAEPVQHAAGLALPGPALTRPELKSVHHFRNTWSKLSADRQLTQALNQAPRNAGPINSHMLVLRSLALMREVSPDYLNRFMSYADTLLCLEQNEKEQLLAARVDPDAGSAKKVKVRRAR
jgi:Protein of unknown function (DUF2894)